MKKAWLTPGGGTGNLVIEFSETGTPDPDNPDCTRYYSTVTAQEALNVLNNGGNVFIKSLELDMSTNFDLITSYSDFTESEEATSDFSFSANYLTYQADSADGFIYKLNCGMS